MVSLVFRFCFNCCFNSVCSFGLRSLLEFVHVSVYLFFCCVFYSSDARKAVRCQCGFTETRLKGRRVCEKMRPCEPPVVTKRHIAEKYMYVCLFVLVKVLLLLVFSSALPFRCGKVQMAVWFTDLELQLIFKYSNGIVFLWVTKYCHTRVLEKPLTSIHYCTWCIIITCLYSNLPCT